MHYYIPLISVHWPMLIAASNYNCFTLYFSIFHFETFDNIFLQSLPSFPEQFLLIKESNIRILVVHNIHRAQHLKYTHNMYNKYMNTRRRLIPNWEFYLRMRTLRMEWTKTISITYLETHFISYESLWNCTCVSHWVNSNVITNTLRE